MINSAERKILALERLARLIIFLQFIFLNPDAINAICLSFFRLAATVSVAGCRLYELDRVIFSVSRVNVDGE